MSSLLEKLPTILVLAVLVGIFVSLQKHSHSKRIRLWIVGWALIFVHFLIQVFEVNGRTGFPEVLYDSIDLVSLELSGVVFLVSLTAAFESTPRRRLLFAVVGLPVAIHAIGLELDWHIRSVMVSCVALPFVAGLALPYILDRRISLFRVLMSGVVVSAGVWSVQAQMHGDGGPATISFLTLGFALSGVFFWRRSQQWTPGVVTVVGGFLAWGAVFPTGTLLSIWYPNLQVNPEIWNVPKFFVAFGMILTLLEEKSRIIEESNVRKNAENAMLQRFSRVTSHLLTAAEPEGLCDEICEAVTQTPGFQRAAILLATPDGRLRVSSARGYLADEGALLAQEMQQLRVAQVQSLCHDAERIGGHSHLLCEQALSSTDGNEQRARVLDGRHVVISLNSSRGPALGWLLISLSENSAVPDAADISKVEMLAADLAVTIENARLRHQLIRSEKLAGLGQLVAGAAHELNNPLTGIIGYSELLGEELQGTGASKRANNIAKEAWRMKRIVDGLLRFARKSNAQTSATNLESAVQDAVLLREHDFHSRGVTLQVDINPDLPDVAIGADELKQVLFNILNNAADALEHSDEKCIHIHGSRRSERVELRIEDSGPGFSDSNRAFDPFYTTKPIGKGTGLGLSICYGIVQECGGDIQISNREPRGAVVVIELPVAATVADE